MGNKIFFILGFKINLGRNFMLYLKVMELIFKEDRVLEKGNSLIDYSDVRRMIKASTPEGKRCAKLSWKGLGSEHDIYIRETPEEIVKKHIIPAIEAKHQKLISGDFQEVRIRQIEVPVASVQRRVELQKSKESKESEEFAEKEVTEFRTQFEEFGE